MRKLLLLFTAICAIIILEQITVLHFNISDKNNYLYGYENYIEKLHTNTEHPRIILLGGSSLGWGVSAQDMTQRLGIQTLNGGIDAVMGYKAMFELSEEYISKQDLIVISPEWTLAEMSSKRNNVYCYIKNNILREFDHVCIGNGINRLMRLTHFSPFGAGNISSRFNKFGDYVHREDKVNMKGNIALNSICNNLPRQKDLDDYILYFERIKNDGHQVLYIHNIIPDSSCTDKSKLFELHSDLNQNFGMPGYTSNRLFLPDELFYNTEYHLTDEGVAIKTNLFIDHLKKYLYD